MVDAAQAAAGYTPLRSHRYERKFLVEELIPPQVEALIRLHPRMFYAPYPPRYVNNLYLDTPDLRNYYDNMHGAARRRKVRVRWYGDLLGAIGRPLLEFKVKDGLVGRKHSYPLAGLDLDGRWGDHLLQEVLVRSDLPEAVWRDLRGLQVVLLNRYYRQYYATRDGLFRATIDTGVTYYRVHGRLGHALAHRQVDHRSVVVELKYEVDQEPSADRVAGFFPFRLTRNSKYVQGMERVYF